MPRADGRARPRLASTALLAGLLAAVAALMVAAPVQAAGRHHAHSARASRPLIARRVSRRAVPAWGTTVYGASAPYYIYGPGGGDAWGYDPIGGPQHVGDGGPARNF